MRSTGEINGTGNEVLKKWIYIIIVVLALGFGAYGYFKVKKWVRYAAIEKYEKPITDYTITKVYYDKGTYKKRHRGTGDDDVEEKKPDYYMEVLYKGKNYKLEIEEYTYSKYNDSGEITLYYDAKGDEIFVAGTGGGNLLVVALAAIVLLIVIVFLVIRLLIKKPHPLPLSKGRGE